MNGGNGFHGAGGNAAFQQPPRTNGVFVPSRILVPLSLAILLMIGLQGKALVQVLHDQQQQRAAGPSSSSGSNTWVALPRAGSASTSSSSESVVDASALRFTNNINSLRGGVNYHNNEQCRWYLAESAVPFGGLGVYTAIGLHPGDVVGFPDICIFVSDAPDHWTHLRSHSFGTGTFFGQYEGRNSRAACEGFTTNYNTVPDAMVNTELVSPVLPTNAGLARDTSPGAGAITHHFGIHGRAKDVIVAGSELTINYGDWDFDKDKEYFKPVREVNWLREHGWCIDNIEIGLSRIPDAGRGAFARVPLPKDTVVAPVPLQCFKDREIFQETDPEQLYVNYCLQPKDSHMIFFPYGAAVNLINHSSRAPNVKLRWSTKSQHHASWLDLSYDEFWKVASPGGLLLEVVATQTIPAGAELLLDYGPAWEAAWQRHVAQWKPPANAEEYVYPADMDETEPLRTMREQETHPYPANLATICTVNDWGQKNLHVEWKEPTTEFEWSEMMAYCHILEREQDKETGDFFYTVAPIFSYNPKKISYDPSIPEAQRHMVFHVPRRAIRFMEIPYMDDEHLPGAFRHPIELPPELVPEAWKNDKIQQ